MTKKPRSRWDYEDAVWMALAAPVMYTALNTVWRFLIRPEVQAISGSERVRDAVKNALDKAEKGD